MSSPQYLSMLADVGREIGVPRLAPGATGGIRMTMDSGTVAGLEQVGEEVLVHVAEPLRFGGAALVLKALKKAAATQPGEPALQPGLRTTTDGEWLVVGSRLALQDASARAVLQRIGWLREWVARLES